MKKKIIIATILAFSFAYANAEKSLAQSKGFKLGKWVELQTSILSELNRSYVDSLPIDRIEKAGITAMLADLDPYTVFIPEENDEDLQMMLNKTYGGIGAIIYKPEKNGNLIINEPYKNSPADKQGLVCGDEIISIDGISTNGLDAKQCSDRMKGKPGTKVIFKVKKVRGGDTLKVAVTRERIHLPDIEYSGMLNDTTGYILQTGFTENVSSAVKAAYLKLKSQGMKKLVLDLRGNGGGLMNEAIEIVSLFVPKGSLVVSQKGNSAESTQEYRTSKEPIDSEIPILILVNGGSASSSEIVAGAMQDLDRATIMGTRTFGKGLVQSIRPLPYNNKLKITTAKYYTPSGRCVQAIDYAHKNKDGDAVQIPDSLTKEFKTMKGRIVRDGGGITPDIKLNDKNYSRLTYSLVLNGIIEQYTLKYVKEHNSIDRNFNFNDKDYADFIAFAKTKEFDFRSSAKAIFDQMKKELEKDGLAESMKDQLEAMNKALEMDKEKFLLLKKAEIIPFIEEEIVSRYFYQEAGIEVRIKYDNQLKEALKTNLINFKNL